MRSAAVLVVLMAACSADDDTLVVDLGVITRSFDVTPSIEHRAVAQSGTDVAVTVLTYGSDCTWPKRTDIEVSGLSAVIRPFDENAVESFCGDAVFTYRRTISVRFDQRGTAMITVFGYEEGDRFGTVIERSSTLEIR